MPLLIYYVPENILGFNEYITEAVQFHLRQSFIYRTCEDGKCALSVCGMAYITQGSGF